jgi:uncharacterized membrane protein
LKDFRRASIFIVLVAIIGVSGVYFYMFNAGLSDDSGKWSDFGGYIGGLIGPLISFVTLLAVLQTVYLQKQLLDTQQAEFKDLMKLQRDTFDAQVRQVNNAISIADRDHIERTREACLQMIDRQILHTENKMARAGKTFEQTFQLKTESGEQEADIRNTLKNQIIMYTNLLNDLVGYSVRVSQDSYNSAEDMLISFREEMHRIYAKNGRGDTEAES